MNKTLIVIAGPTASGKTDLSVQLAQHFGTEIISADSRQFYRETEIGTAKPSPEQLAAVPHHFINSLSIHDAYTVGQYEHDALEIAGNIFQNNDYAVVVGGSGLFIKALCDGLDEMPEIAPEVRSTLNEELEIRGLNALVLELKEADAAYAAEADLKNPRRVIRALEVYRGTGRPFSSFRTGAGNTRNFSAIKFLLLPDRKLLYERIDRRMDLMIAAGLEQEARTLHPLRALPALQTVGYTEFFDYFEEKYDRDECIRLLKRNSRRYAKRQITWFSKDAELHLINSPAETLLGKCVAIINDRQR